MVYRQCLPILVHIKNNTNSNVTPTVMGEIQEIYGIFISNYTYSKKKRTIICHVAVYVQTRGY